MAKFQQRVIFEGYVGALQSLRRHGDTPVIDFRLRVPSLRATGEGDDRDLEDAKGFWVTVTVWGQDAALVNDFLRVGARVVVNGVQSLDEYPSTQPETAGQTQTSLKVRADEVSLSLRGLEQVAFKPRKTSSGETPAEAAEHAQAFDHTVPAGDAVV